MAEPGENRSAVDHVATPEDRGDEVGLNLAGATDRGGTLAGRVAAVQQRAVRSVDSARARSRLVDAAATIILRPRLVADTILAGYLALRLFVLLFPLAYLIVAGLGLYAKEGTGDPATIAAEVGLARAVAASIAEAGQSSSRGHWLALAVGLVATLWAARAVLRALRGGFALIWNMPPPKTSASPLGPLVVAASVLALALQASLLEKLRSNGVPWWLVSLVALALQGGLWLAASVMLPHTAPHWYQLLPGAVLFCVGIQSLSLAATLYFGPKAANAAAAYGVLGIGLVLVSALIMCGWVVLLSAELNAGLQHWRSGSTASPRGSR